jgi:rhodanese-related sulfurtransferase
MNNQNILFIILGIVVAVFLVRTLLGARSGASPADAKAALDAGTAALVDVREPAEWSSGVAAPASLLAFSDLRGPRKTWNAFLAKNRGKKLFLYCASGARSGSAAALLRREGFDAVNLGGFSRWVSSGLPTRQPR